MPKRSLLGTKDLTCLNFKKRSIELTLNSCPEDLFPEEIEVDEFWQDEPNEYEWDSNYEGVHFHGELLQVGDH
jgi:hypothetical protein